MKFKDAKTFRISGLEYKYLITYDYDAGRKNVYNVLKFGALHLSHNLVEIIGRELDMKNVKLVIKRSEEDYYRLINLAPTKKNLFIGD